MKKWKKLLTIICACAMVFLFNVTAFAAENDSANQLDLQSQNVFGMDAMSNNENEDGIMPYLTITGDGGSCTLDYMSSGKYIAWSVKPATILTYTFAGEIDIYTNSTGAYKGTGLCSGFGIGTESGIVDVSGMGLRSGVKYKAVFTGTATDIGGNVFTVSSTAVLRFTY